MNHVHKLINRTTIAGRMTANGRKLKSHNKQLALYRNTDVQRKKIKTAKTILKTSPHLHGDRREIRRVLDSGADAPVGCARPEGGVGERPLRPVTRPRPRARPRRLRGREDRLEHEPRGRNLEQIDEQKETQLERTERPQFVEKVVEVRHGDGARSAVNARTCPTNQNAVSAVRRFMVVLIKA